MGSARKEGKGEEREEGEVAFEEFHDQCVFFSSAEHLDHDGDDKAQL